jgi:histidinol-phosphate/aromatic aminotransferase/cobyric acid decarboxylase-like protein
MLRHQWNFTYTGEELAEAARKKLEYHNARLAWWRSTREQKFDEIKKEGLTIHESVAGGTGNTTFTFTNNYQQPTVMIDNKLQNQLNECQNKVQEHMSRVKEYEGWMDVMKAQGKHSFELHHDDWQFFFSTR